MLCRGLDNRVYYMLAPQGQYYNYSGCGNTLNCNHPVVRQFITACLRYWVTEVSSCFDWNVCKPHHMAAVSVADDRGEHVLQMERLQSASHGRSFSG